MNVNIIASFDLGEVKKSLRTVSARLAFGVALLLIFGASVAMAQTGGEAGIQGTVTDPTGASICRFFWTYSSNPFALTETV